MSNQIPSSRLIQPGVIANASQRPATPFQGQCIYQVDTNQLLVWNGTAWVIPNQTTTNPTGLEYVAGSSFTGVNTFDVTGFSSTYLFYDLKLTIASTSTAGINAQLVQGTTVRNTNYYGATFFTSYLNTSGIQTVKNNATEFYLGDTTANPPSLFVLNIRGVANSEFAVTIQGFDMANTRSLMGAYSNYAGTNSYDRIRFYSIGGQNVAGSWTLMGVRK